MPVPTALPVSRLSYTGLASYDRCGYRFYLERALRLPAPARHPPAGGEAPTGLSALARGAIVHQLLEQVDFGDPRPPAREDVRALLAAHGEEAREPDVDDLVAMVERFLGAPICARIASAGTPRTELPFQFTLATSAGRSLLINGVVDVHAEEPGRTLVIDYKSDRLGEQDPAQLTEAQYATQRIVYALAALRAGAERVEVTYVFLERPDDPVSQEFPASDARGARAAAQRAGRRRHRGPLRAHATSPTGPCATTARGALPSAAGVRSARSRTSPWRAPRDLLSVGSGP